MDQARFDDSIARMLQGRFGDIRDASLSFAHTAPDGTVTQRGLAH